MNDSFENKSNLNGFDEVTRNGREQDDSIHTKTARTERAVPLTEIKPESVSPQSAYGGQSDYITESTEYHFKGTPYEEKETQTAYGYESAVAKEKEPAADPYGYNSAGTAAPSANPQSAPTANAGSGNIYGYDKTANQNTVGYTGYGYYTGGYGSYSGQGTGHSSQGGYSTSGYGAGYTGQPAAPVREGTPKAKKTKKRFGAATVFISGLCTAIVGGMLSAAIMFYGVMPGYTADNGVSTPTPMINVDTSANSNTEAIAQKVGPSVVGIRTTASYGLNFFGQQQESSGEGSGIIYSADGYIVTNYHVIQEATGSGGVDAKVEVFLADDAETAFPATVVGYDATADLAVIKIEKTGLTPIELGDSDTLKVGELAVAIGNPGGLDFMGSVSAGIISGLNRTIQLENSAGTEMNLIQTDAAINPGNSGGALVNVQGQLIGVNSAKLAADGFEGMGFAIPSNSMVEICKNIIENKDEKKPYVGIEVSTQYNEENLTAMGYPAGLVVANVVENGPAAQAGIQRSDIITEFNGTEVKTFDAFNSLKNKCKVGDTVTLKVYRLGQYYDVPLTLGETV